ncbi:D-amino acid oxidase family protein [Proteus myxofaciens ATCC 19692]|uniref:D-amino acid oxidase family protein n=1 Tax=Proteus myxofaciens ATCC 19692 TaxID=1354337 RepID=A0A198FL01_9GAMM|nr:D-amino acid oxidase family protein [Proteus myxofaciens ATCC 19692]
MVEKDNIGSAASGRNGGQLTPGLARWEATDMIANLSIDEAKRLWRFSSIEAIEMINDIATRYSLDLDIRHGHITAAVHSGHMNSLIESADARRHLGDDKIKIVGAYELDQYIKSQIYHGATIDDLGGQIHPLALLRTLIYGAVENGASIYEFTKALDIQQTPSCAIITTEEGIITAKKGVVVAVHNTTFQFLSGVTGTTVPFYTYVGVTPPLRIDIKTLLPTDMAVYDTQFQIDYYRAVRSNRLLFGGQGTGTSWSPKKINDYLLERIGTVFPQLGQTELEYSWSGISDFTLNGATDCRKIGDNIPTYLVHGWSGHGVAQTVRIGKAISDDIMGENDDFSMLTRIEHMNIPLGRQLSPMAIPLVKAAVGISNTVNPSKLVSF